MKPWETFLSQHHTLTIATQAESGPWCATVFAVLFEKKMYFISSPETTHSKHIMHNSHVSIACSWHEPGNHQNRKGIQATGTCQKAETDEEIECGVQLHNKYFPEFAERITVEWTKQNSAVWIITPTYIKYWDDELYPKKKTMNQEL